MFKDIFFIKWREEYERITTNGILRVKTLIKNISEITRGTIYIWICAGGYCGTTLH